MQIGLALPQYDESVPGDAPLRWETLLECARLAERCGYDSLWLSDHLTFDTAKYGGSPVPQRAFEPLGTLAALARLVRRPRLGTLVLCEALRPPGVLAKALATLDRLSGGRLEIGIGAGWYEPDYEAVGLAFPSPGERLDRLRETVAVLQELLARGADGEQRGTGTVEGRFHSLSGARNLPPAVQSPRPPVTIGGKGDRLLRMVAEVADGWNTAWVWTPEAYRGRVEVLDRACEAVGRDPATVHRSLGLYTLCGEDERDLARRFRRLRAANPGVLGGVDLAQWRVGRLVGTVEQVREQAAGWGDLGVDALVLGLGAVPFQMVAASDVEVAAHALGRSEGRPGRE